MTMFSMVFAVMLIGGSGNAELLDFVDTQSYWQGQAIEPTVQTLLPLAAPVTEDQPGQAKDISDLIAQLGARSFEDREAASARIAAMGPSVIPQLKQATDSDDPEIALRARQLIDKVSGNEDYWDAQQLMAIRTLGELGDKQALPTLKKLTQRDEPFVAEYARRAIAKIHGRKWTPPQPDARRLQQDVLALPAKTHTVIQARDLTSGQVSVEQLFKDMPAMPGMSADALRQQVHEGVLQAIREVGNVRVASATVGIEGNPDDEGAVIVILRGRYDPRAIRAAIKRHENDHAEQIEGVTVCRPDDDVALIMISNELLVFMASDDGDLPIAETILAMKDNTPRLSMDSPVGKLIAGVEPKKHMAWAASVLPDELREADVIEPFTTAVLTVDRSREGFAGKLIATGEDAEELGEAVKQFKQHLAEGIEQMQRMAMGIPAAKSMLDAMKSIEIATGQDGKQVTVTGEYKGNPAMIMGTYILGMRATAPAQPPAQAVPMRAVRPQPAQFVPMPANAAPPQ